MPSQIDPTRPLDGVPASKAELRANLLAAKDEIEALQGALLLPPLEKTASFTFALADIGKAIEATSSNPIVATVPTNASAGFPVGTVLFLLRVGTGTVSIAAASGVTIERSSGTEAEIARQWGPGVSIRKRGTNAWHLSGDLTEAA